MPKMNKAESQKREEWALNLLKSNPTLPASRVNERVQAQFGSKLGPNKLYKLASLARAGLADGKPTKTEIEAPVQVVAERRPRTVVEAPPQVRARVDSSEALPQLIHFHEGETPTNMLKRVLDRLREVGQTRLGIVGGTGRYIVIDNT